ncbi:MAG: efflux RND transporter periplasmic adaptor subunit [Pseudomonadota bacterium]
MKKPLYCPLTIFYSLLATLLLISSPARAAGDIPISTAQIKSMGIAVAPLQLATVMPSQRFPARVVIPPASERVVSAPQSGLVETLHVAVGDKIGSGQTLASIRSTELVALQSQYLQALTTARLAESEFARDEQLFRDGIIAERRYLITRSRREEQAANLNEHRQELRLSGMSEIAIQRLEQTRQMGGALPITAPITGVVLEQKVVTGQRVDRLEPLYRLARLDTLWLELRVPQERTKGLKAGQAVEIPGLDATGKLIMIGRDVDPENQTVLLRAEVTRGTERLRPGQFIEAQLAAPVTGKGYTVPAAAIARGTDKSVIFVQTAQGFSARQITVVSEANGRSVITGELRGDEQVAVRGVVAIKGAWMGLGGGAHE